MASIVRSVRAVRPSVACSLLARTKAASPIHRPTTAFTARCFSASAHRAIRKYTKDHEWVDLNEAKKTAVVGISEYAAEALGDVVYVELPETGTIIKQGDALGAVESVKSAADINAPLSGKVTSVNLLLEEKPGTINRVPEDDSAGGGWVCKMTIEDVAATKAELEALMDADAYREFTAAAAEEDQH